MKPPRVAHTMLKLVSTRVGMVIGSVVYVGNEAKFTLGFVRVVCRLEEVTWRVSVWSNVTIAYVIEAVKTLPPRSIQTKQKFV
jgi:hypothetical protein